MPAPTLPIHEAALVAQCLAALDTLGVGKVEPLHRRPAAMHRPEFAPDAWLRLRGPWGQATYACEAKRTVTHATLGAVAAQLERLAPPKARALLLTHYVPPELGVAMRDRKIEFVDTAGNAHIQAAGLHVWTLGHKPAQQPPRRGTLLNPAGLRVLYQVLRAPQTTLALTQRGLAEVAAVALGGIGPIVTELQAQAWIGGRGPKRALREPRRALARFEEGYAERLRDRLGPLVCRQRPEVTLEALATRVRNLYPDGRVLIGGELGAAALTGALRPQTATLHVQGGDLLAVMKALDLLPDPRGTITLLPPIGGVGTDAGPNGIADPILVRAELLVQPDDRLLEVAGVLLVDHIEPRWQ